MIWGLVKKEFQMLGVFFIFFTIFVICSLASGIFNAIGLDPEESSNEFLFSQNTLIVLTVGIFCLTLLLTSYQYDDKSNWNKFIIANGARRLDLFYGKIIFILILCSIFGVECLIVECFNPFATWISIVGTVFLNTFMFLILSLIIQLLSVIFGGIKANLFFGIVLGIGTGILVLINFGILDISEKTMQIAYVFSVLAVEILIFVALFFINKTVITRKDY